MNRYQAFEIWELLQASDRFPYVGKPQRARIMERLPVICAGFEIPNASIVAALEDLTAGVHRNTKDPLGALLDRLEAKMSGQRRPLMFDQVANSVHWSELEPMPEKDFRRALKEARDVLANNA